MFHVQETEYKLLSFSHAVKITITIYNVYEVNKNKIHILMFTHCEASGCAHMSCNPYNRRNL